MFQSTFTSMADREKAKSLIEASDSAQQDERKRNELAKAAREALQHAKIAAEDIRRERLRQAKRTFKTAVVLLIQTSRIEKARQPCSPLIPLIRDKIGHLSRLFSKKIIRHQYI